jgi:hypothetical protein
MGEESKGSSEDLDTFRRIITDANLDEEDG